MNDELGEFVGKGFAILRKRIKEVEGRKMPVVIHGNDAVVDYDKIRLMLPEPIPGNDGVVDYAKIKAMIPDPVKGDDGVVDYDKIRLMIPPPIPGEDGEDAVVDYARIEAMIPPPLEGDPGKDAVVDYEKVRRMIPPAIVPEDGNDGMDGRGIADAKINSKGHLILTLTDGTKKDVGRVRGKDAQQFQGMIAGGPSGGAAVVNDWIKLTTSFSSTPTLNTALLGGSVYNYLYNSDTLTLFRYIAADGSDKFFKNFDGTNLTNLIASKAQTITL